MNSDNKLCITPNCKNASRIVQGEHGDHQFVSFSQINQITLLVQQHLYEEKLLFRDFKVIVDLAHNLIKSFNKFDSYFQQHKKHLTESIEQVLGKKCFEKVNIIVDEYNLKRWFDQYLVKDALGSIKAIAQQIIDAAIKYENEMKLTQILQLPEKQEKNLFQSEVSWDKSKKSKNIEILNNLAIHQEGCSFNDYALINPIFSYEDQITINLLAFEGWVL